MTRCWPRATSCWAWPRKSPVLAGVRPEGLEDTPQLQLNIDRDKANALGVAFADINATLSTAFGSSYINDFPNAGRLQRVIVQADAPKTALQPEDIGRAVCHNSAGDMVPFSAFSPPRWNTGPVQLIRYNGYPAMNLRQCRAGPQHRRGDGRDGAPGGAAADRLRL